MTDAENKQESALVDQTSRSLAKAAIVISLIAALAALFTAYNSWTNAEAAVARVRPFLGISVLDPVKVEDVLLIPIQIENTGQTRGVIDSVRLIFWRDNRGGFRYVESKECVGSVLAPTGVKRCEIRPSRYQEVNGSRIDISQGVDSSRRITVEIRYHGMDIRSSFEESLNIPVSWDD